MKKTVCKTSAWLLLPVCLFLWMSFSSTKKNKLFRPPGTQMLKSGLYMDVQEISNINWKEYQSWYKEKEGEDSEAYKKIQPDKSVWELEGMDMNPVVNTYFDHPSYNDYPIVGINQQMAIDYCTWRTARVKEMINANPKIKKSLQGAWPIFEYRLPTKAEWESAAANVMSLDHHSKKVRKNVEGKSINCRFNVYVEKRPEVAMLITSPVRSFLPSEEGLYNLLGNVAEMVQEPGIAKGGSYQHSIEASSPDLDISYEDPASWLGFRCACEVSYTHH